MRLKLITILILTFMPVTMMAQTTNYIYHINGISYCLYDNNKTACVVHSYDYKGNITIPNTVYHYGKTYTVTKIDGAFHDCKITSIKIPNSVTEITHNVFGHCNFLESINVASDNPVYE